MKTSGIENRLRRMTWSEPSPGLRDQIIADAAVTERSVAWSDRMWFSRTWRWSAAAFVCAVMAIGQWPGADAEDRSGLSSQAAAAARAIEETAREAGLPSAAAARLAQRAVASPQPVLARDLAAVAAFEGNGGLQ